VLRPGADVARRQPCGLSSDCLPDCAGFKDADVIGSPELVQTLIEHELIDEFRLMIDPLLVGGGKRIFQDDGASPRWSWSRVT
jgi:dihydrofolate reductase